MPSFSYKAVSAERGQVDGLVDADSLAGAVAKLSEDGVYPWRLELARQDLRRDLPPAAGAATQAAALFSTKISAAELSAGLRQLADLLEAGLPVLGALEMAAGQSGATPLGRLFT